MRGARNVTWSDQAESACSEDSRSSCVPACLSSLLATLTKPEREEAPSTHADIDTALPQVVVTPKQVAGRRSCASEHFDNPLPQVRRPSTNISWSLQSTDRLLSIH
jgi:hypothetical protein